MDRPTHHHDPRPQASNILTVEEAAKAFANLMEMDPSILFITGAGISVESGLPTYRGVAGLYNEPDEETGLPIEQIVSGHMWKQRPDFVFTHLKQIADACSGAEPNDAHKLIAALERKLDRVWVLTQNVDGLHHRAGSNNVIAIHGDAFTMDCTASPEHQWRVEDYSEFGDTSPVCPTCGSMGRPAVVLFGEMLPEDEVEKYRQEITVKGFDLVVSIGTSHQFHYIDTPVEKAPEWGALSIEINPGPSEITELFTYRVRAGAAETARAIAKALDLEL